MSESAGLSVAERTQFLWDQAQLSGIWHLDAGSNAHLADDGHSSTFLSARSVL